MTDATPKKRERFCWVCGDSRGIIDDRNYLRSDTCGMPSCEREARDQERAEREEAHERLDRDRGWDR
jgi:hypothetical protein